jgi:hypothetical protein
MILFNKNKKIVNGIKISYKILKVNKILLLFYNKIINNNL